MPPGIVGHCAHLLDRRSSRDNTISIEHCVDPSRSRLLGSSYSFVDRVPRREAAGQVGHDHAIGFRVSADFDGDRIADRPLLQSGLLANAGERPNA